MLLVNKLAFHCRFKSFDTCTRWSDLNGTWHRPLDWRFRKAIAIQWSAITSINVGRNVRYSASTSTGNLLLWAFVRYSAFRKGCDWLCKIGCCPIDWNLSSLRPLIFQILLAVWVVEVWNPSLKAKLQSRSDESPHYMLIITDIIIPTSTIQWKRNWRRNAQWTSYRNTREKKLPVE